MNAHSLRKLRGCRNQNKQPIKSLAIIRVIKDTRSVSNTKRQFIQHACDARAINYARQATCNIDGYSLTNTWTAKTEYVIPWLDVRSNACYKMSNSWFFACHCLLKCLSLTGRLWSLQTAFATAPEFTTHSELYQSGDMPHQNAQWRMPTAQNGAYLNLQKGRSHSSADCSWNANNQPVDRMRKTNV